MQDNSTIEQKRISTLGIFKYLFITNQPEIAKIIEEAGIDRIFIDLETLGKDARQGHLNTVKSRHTFSDIEKVKRSLSQAELLVRLNPFHEKSRDEINTAIDTGTDIIMLPMIQSLNAVEQFAEMIAGRAKFIPLIETIFSAKHINEIETIAGVDELHIGLNDLHLELNLWFMFELFTNGWIDKMVTNLSKPFGIGGISRVGGGLVDGKQVLAQHIRLGSSGVILSRNFSSEMGSLMSLSGRANFRKEFLKLEQERVRLAKLSIQELDQIGLLFRNQVTEVANSLKNIESPNTGSQNTN